MHKRLMIVDDSPVMRAFVRRTIQVTGLPTSGFLEASNGEEALLRLRAALNTAGADPIDLILTDINMPVMDGEGFLAQLKLDPALSSIPVVVVSTDSTEQRVGALLRLGASDYVRKPFPPERLSEVLCRLLPDWIEPAPAWTDQPGEDLERDF
jgi:two-component system chemotaxis response regulator CheY